MSPRISRQPVPPPALWCALAVTAASLLLASCGGGGSSSSGSSPVQIQTLSNRADLISDGDALVQITTPSGLVKEKLRVTLNGTDVSSAFTEQSSGRLVGRVTGLVNGQNDLQATFTDG